jgi:hypothetical protein
MKDIEAVDAHACALGRVDDAPLATKTPIGPRHERFIELGD